MKVPSHVPCFLFFPFLEKAIPFSNVNIKRLFFFFNPITLSFTSDKYLINSTATSGEKLGYVTGICVFPS